jgi:hypothetical protein
MCCYEFVLCSIDLTLNDTIISRLLRELGSKAPSKKRNFGNN